MNSPECLSGVKKNDEFELIPMSSVEQLARLDLADGVRIEG